MPLSVGLQLFSPIDTRLLTSSLKPSHLLLLDVTIQARRVLMESPNEEVAPIDFSLLEKDGDLRQRVGAQMEALGYVVLIPPAKMASRLRKVRKDSKKFFLNTSPAEKDITCCEYMKPTGGLRDRLEIRVRREKTKRAFAALKRDQFASGYDNQLNKASSKLIESYFPQDILVKAHGDLETMANRVLELLCDYVGYSEHDGLATRLKEEKDTPGVLRLLRYATQGPNVAETGVENRSVELAIDHTDIGLITVMPHSDAETLQILSRDFKWIDVEKGQPEDSVVVIVGEQLAFLSNYRLQAVRHRVVSSSSLPTRFSLPFLMRSPADFELGQVGSERRRLSKSVLNHTFELHESLASATRAASRLLLAYQEASAGSKRITHLVGASIAQNIFSDPLLPWPLFLFFEDRTPSSSSHKRFRSSCAECSDRSSLTGDLQPTTTNLLSIDGKGWNPSEWINIDIKYFTCTFEEHRFLILPIPLATVDWSKFPNDLLWSIRSTVVIHGRPRLEASCDLNSHRAR